MAYDFRSPPLVASDLSSSNTKKVHCSSVLANWLGLVKGVIITEAWYWTSTKAHEWDGWFYRSQKDWEEKTGLSKDEIFPRLKDFEEKNWIERRRAKNPDPKADPKSWVTFYRCTTKFNDDYEEYLKNLAISDKDKNGGNNNIVNSDNEGGNNIGISENDKGVIIGKDDKDTKTTSDIPKMISPEPLHTNTHSASQGTIDQGSHEQGTIDQGSHRNENDNRSQNETSNGSVDTLHPLGSDSRGASHHESQVSLTETHEYQVFLDVYNENKPDRWSKAEKLTSTRIKMLDRLTKDYGDKSLTMLQRALVGAKRSQFWSGLDYKFDYLYREKGSNGENGDKITGLAESVPEEDLYSERVDLTQSGVEMMDDYKRMKAALAMFEQEAS
jgi:hypothetical protein